MLTKQGVAVMFYCHYVESKVSKTGLTVTIDVWEVNTSGTATEVVTGGSATEVGDGIYRYQLASGSVDSSGEYIAVFKTSTSTVDQQHLPALWVIDKTILADTVALSGDTTAADNAEAFFDGTGYAGTNNVIPTVTTLTNGVNVTSISGDSTAADNAEAFFDGTGYAGTNNVIPTVTTVTNAVSANVTQISGDTTAADNLEAMLDGTGSVTLTTNITGNITGNLSGSVGSVTGNVGGNVVGSVASVSGAVGSVTATVSADVVSISGDSTAADNCESFFDGTGYAGTNNVIPTVTTVTTTTTATNVTTVNGLAAGVITAASIATGAIDADALATDAVTEITAAIEAIAIETGITFTEAIRYIASACCGVASGLATTTAVYKAIDNSGTTRITATVDADGNRSAVTLA